MDHSSQAAGIKREPVRLSVLLNLFAVTLTCFLTRELKPCQDLVILPALNTEGGWGGLLMNLQTPKSAFCLLCAVSGTGWLPYSALTHQPVCLTAPGLLGKTSIIHHFSLPPYHPHQQSLPPPPPSLAPLPHHYLYHQHSTEK